MSTEAQLKAALEEELDELHNVADETGDSDASTSGDLFSISSYGVDQTVDALVKRLKKGQYFIPGFQRKYVWSKNDASKFVESLLLGLPVPGVFLYKESDTQKHLVIDGQQRLKSLERYYDGVFGERVFKLSGLKTRWNDLSYADLDEDDKSRLDDAIVHATIFKQDTPGDNMDSVYEVFERINTGGVKLSAQEIRSCVAHGKFNDLLFSLNANPTWRSIYGAVSSRLKDVELILRFFAFHANIKNYKRPMKKFLSDFMDAHRNPSDKEIAQYRRSWETTLSRIGSALPDRPFRPGGRALNVAFFDSFSAALASQKASQLTSAQIRSAYDALLEDEEFGGLISRSTADDENVKRRAAICSKALRNAASS